MQLQQAKNLSMLVINRTGNDSHKHFVFVVDEFELF